MAPLERSEPSVEGRRVASAPEDMAGSPVEDREQAAGSRDTVGSQLAGSEDTVSTAVELRTAHSRTEPLPSAADSRREHWGPFERAPKTKS